MNIDHASSLNADFEQRVVVPPPKDVDWVLSPCEGVMRHRLDLDVTPSGERATTVVQYQPGASFSGHTHHGGEEFLVLSGVFEDQHGIYPQGTYVRNPPGSRHAPSSRDGCTLFVKLCQFTPGDNQSVRMDTANAEWFPGLVHGLQVLPLHEHNGVSTALVRWSPNTQFNTHTHPGGEEIYVLEGLFKDEYGEYPAGTWLRNPCWSRHTPYTQNEGALIYVKVGHIGAAFA